MRLRGWHGAVVLAVAVATAIALIAVGRHPGDPLPREAAPVATPSASPAPTVRVEPEPEPSPTPSPDPAAAADARAGVLGTDVAAAGDGTFVVADGEQPAPGAGRAVLVRVEVESGLPVDVDAFASFVMATLNDERGWPAVDDVSFARTTGEAEIRVVLATGATVDALCAPLPTVGVYSCGRNGHAALNAERFVLGTSPFVDAGGTVEGYREYLVNHEVGHLLGHQHEACPAPGAVAPVMVQQSIDVGGCVPNGWPAAG
ncbi:conserved hypothetical protein [Beutenbergia cavernae DSM 12333]|uniref:DUF3152 domain-containing protein n=1 Tax=Beutenbergia cavernae (strain ATCC BAA-8 / DSM 12333 / CCUG 43141 / JCM 11478 / NBRC 16432 / NCIMB 13614 / HKI 0122) TaxID=471853 RepID=C5BZ33_BEUC1|nr:DUF3152 domain-containing protein [Beutenbergia cavernae]ACQ81148.1 conserved hypothetical protein [Beutenbergia cavernae DSM 12333]